MKQQIGKKQHGKKKTKNKMRGLLLRDCLNC